MTREELTTSSTKIYTIETIEKWRSSVGQKSGMKPQVAQKFNKNTSRNNPKQTLQLKTIQATLLTTEKMNANICKHV